MKDETMKTLIQYGSDIVKMSATSGTKTILTELKADNVLDKAEIAILTDPNMDPFARRFFENGLATGVLLASVAIIGKLTELEGLDLHNLSHL